MNELQTKILNIYRVVSGICEKKGIRFFAIGGTAIGAVRHAGFIPWDDDLDIAMPVEDYNRFLNIAREALPSHLRLFEPCDSASYESVFCKVMDERTTVIQRPHIGMPDRYTGAWIDIMPMSGIPGKGIARELYVRQLKALLTVQQATTTVTSGGSIKYRVFTKVMAPLRPVSRSGIFKRQYHAALSRHPFDEASYCGYTWAHELSHLIFPQSWFSDTVEMPFEGITMRMPMGWDAYLTQHFGDYMTIPPKSFQITHDAYVDLDNSYSDYAFGRLSIPESFAREGRR